MAEGAEHLSFCHLFLNGSSVSVWQSARRRLVRVLRAWEINRAVLYALLHRGWQFAAGAVTVLLIATHFDRPAQGYYYTIAGLLALQSFAELGLHAVIVYVTSHEWPRMNADGGGADALESWQRVAAVWKGSLRWYACVAVLFASLVGPLGVWFLQAGDSTAVAWRGPWWSGVVATAATLLLLPSVAVLEGCNQVAVVNRYRLCQAVAGSIAVWAGIVLGYGLWVLAWAVVIRVLAELALLMGPYRAFFMRLWRTPAGGFSWKRELWPLQWRVAVQSGLNYFSIGYAVPVVFRLQGAAMAGRIGMTWSVLTTLQMAGSAWVHTRAPELGSWLAQRRAAEAYGLFRRVLVRSVSFVAASGVLFVLFVLVLEQFSRAVAASPPDSVRWWAALLSRLSERLLPWPPTLLLLVGVLGYHLAACAGVFVRVHKADPLLPVAVVYNVLLAVLLPAATLWLEVTGLALALAVTMWAVAVPGSWAVARRVGRP